VEAGSFGFAATRGLDLTDAQKTQLQQAVSTFDCGSKPDDVATKDYLACDLADASKATFEAFLARQIPGPQPLVDALGLESELVAIERDRHLYIGASQHDVIEPDEAVAAIGSGGPFAKSAATALIVPSPPAASTRRTTARKRGKGRPSAVLASTRRIR